MRIFEVILTIRRFSSVAILLSIGLLLCSIIPYSYSLSTEHSKDASNPVLPTALNPSQSAPYHLGNSNHINLSPHLLYLTDPKGSLSLEQAHTSTYWQQHTAPVANFGYTPIVYWFYIALKNKTQEPLERLLSLNYPLLDHIIIYHSTNNAPFTKLHLGDKKAFSDRPIQHRNFLVPYHFAPLDEHRILIRIATDSSMQLPLFLTTEQYLLEQDQGVMLGQGIYFGIMIAMIFYNLFLYFSFRDNNYLLYILSVACVAIVQATLRGYSYQFLWPEWPTLQHFHMPIVVSLSGASVAFFSLSFLNLRTFHKGFYYVVLGLALVLSANALLSPLLGYPIAVRIGVGVTMLYAIAGLIIGSISWRSGFTPAKYFTGAYFVLFSGTFVIALNKFGFLPRNFFTENAQEIGSVLEVLLLSFALANRINILREEKEQAQLDATIRLEDKVSERTLALNTAMEQLNKTNAQLTQQNKKDGLTGLFNRRDFDTTLAVEWVRAHRNQLPLSLIMVDIDHFKRFNDNYGHLVGDDCLKQVANDIQAAIHRPDDKVFRYGGEEFAILLPGTHGLGALQVAERIRLSIKDHRFITPIDEINITLSLGVNCITPQTPTEQNMLIRTADEALYKAKSNGRNCVVISDNNA